MRALSCNNVSERGVQHIPCRLAEGKLAQFKPRSFLSQFQGVSSQSRGVSHLKEVTQLNALQQSMEKFLNQYHEFQVLRLYAIRTKCNLMSEPASQLYCK